MIDVPDVSLYDKVLKKKQAEKSKKREEGLNRSLNYIIKCLSEGKFSITNACTVENCNRVVELFSKKGWKVDVNISEHQRRQSKRGNTTVAATTYKVVHLIFSKNDNQKRSTNTKARKKVSKAI